jgi:tRNA(Ile2) C34 agmatinyltransferase TiaS
VTPDIHVMDVTKLIDREGWDCPKCGHRHAGRTLGYICIGCPCPATTVAEALALIGAENSR